MLSPSDFNNAVPQFTNGNYASNPLNPQYIAEPSSTDYNRGVEPIQTLPAQWWNWFMNKFTTRFNKVNVYVKNIFNELSQLLTLVSETPSGTEATPTIGQLKDMFETKYPDYLKTAPALSNTYVPQTTMVNGQALSGNVTVTCVACAGANGSGTAFGTAATVNTGTAAGCIPTVGTALGTTDGQFLATDANGKLKPSGYTASCFRASTWTPSCVSHAGSLYCINSQRDFCVYINGSGCGGSLCLKSYNGGSVSPNNEVSVWRADNAACGMCGTTYKAFGTNAFNSTAFTTCTGTVTQVKVGSTAYNPSSGVVSLPAYPTSVTTATCANCITFLNSLCVCSKCVCSCSSCYIYHVCAKSTLSTGRVMGAPLVGCACTCYGLVQNLVSGRIFDTNMRCIGSYSICCYCSDAGHCCFSYSVAAISVW